MAQKSGLSSLTDEQFEVVRRAAIELPEVLKGLQEIVSNRLKTLLAKQAAGIHRHRPPAVVIADLESMRKDDARDEYFQKVATIYRSIANIVVGLPAHEPADSTERRLPLEGISEDQFQAIQNALAILEPLYPPRVSLRGK